MRSKYSNTDGRNVWTTMGIMLKKYPLFGHILLEYLGQPMNFLANPQCIYIYIYICIYIGTNGVINIIVGKGYGYTSSNPGQDCLHFT